MRFGMSSHLLLVIALAVSTGALAQMPTYNLGRAPTAEEVRAWDISIGPEGKELPPGSGTAKKGATIYARKCAACHGPNGEGGVPGGFRSPLMGGEGTLTSSKPVRTIGSFWPFATTIWDFINRSMPRGQEGTLQPDEVYALTAYILHLNDLVQESDVIDAQSLPKIQMPNRNGFVPPRLEDILKKRCRIGTCP